jgi:hypothetical protein
MRCNEILCVEKLERRAVARNLVRSGDQITWRVCESRSVQHLADVASSVGPVVVVQKGDAGCDVEQHYTAKNSERLARELRRENSGW